MAWTRSLDISPWCKVEHTWSLGIATLLSEESTLITNRHTDIPNTALIPPSVGTGSTTERKNICWVSLPERILHQSRPPLNYPLANLHQLYHRSLPSWRVVNQRAGDTPARTAAQSCPSSSAAGGKLFVPSFEWAGSGLDCIACSPYPGHLWALEGCPWAEIALLRSALAVVDACI